MGGMTTFLRVSSVTTGLRTNLRGVNSVNPQAFWKSHLVGDDLMPTRCRFRALREETSTAKLQHTGI